MVKTLRLLKNPFVPAALILSAVFYSGLVKPEEDSFSSLLPEKGICFVSARISSNPVPVSSGKSYLVTVSPYLVKDARGFVSEAKGRLKVLVPKEEAESLYPGKLYSDSSSGAVLLENGLNADFSGRFLEGSSFFKAESCSKGKPDDSFFGKAACFRGRCRLCFRRLMYSWKKAGALVLSLLSGSREYLEEGIEEQFRLAGLSHVLALSGMHLSFFALLSGTAGVTFLGKKASFYFKLSGILFFVWFAGFSPSLYRALVCSLLSLFLGKLCSRPPEQEVILASSFVLHCATRPEDLFTAAFMLSYAALLGIMLLGNPFSRRLTFFLPEKAAGALGSSLGAQGATASISASLFGSITPAGFISGAAVSPLISLFLLFSTAAVVLSLIFPFAADFFGFLVNLLYKAVLFPVRIFALVPSVHFP